ncbi:hypothetical protein I3843_10G097400 [Carya illinoinensis]|nr:hypothetical protein I3843_10G097400 [Carya illinoinensis]
MVSKISKMTLKKYIKDFHTNRQHHRRRRWKSPTKKNDAAFSSINKSLLTCHRHLIKLFSKLAHLDTSNSQHKGCQIHVKIPDQPKCIVYISQLFDNNNHVLLRPFISLKRMVFLDLDETLIHSKLDTSLDRFDFMVRPKIDGEIRNFYMLKSPSVNELLSTLGERFEIVVFMAGLSEYASLMLDQLNRKVVISHWLYRESCKEVDGKFVKDLLGLGRDLRGVVIVENNPNAYKFQPKNAIPIRPFTDNLRDMELERVIKFLEGSDGFEDMREAVKQYVTTDPYNKTL